MVQLIKNKDLYGIALFLLLTVMIGWQEMVAPAIGIFALVVLAEGFIARSLSFRLNMANMLFVLLFILYLAGLLWSEHREIGWKLLEYKMSFFIFPILFFFKKEKTDPWLILDGLIIGSMLLIGRIFWIYFQPGNLLDEYQISNEILKIHPSYACIYLTAAIGMVFLRIMRSRSDINSATSKAGLILKLTDWVKIMIALFFLYVIYRLGSFAGLLFLGLLFTIVLSWYAFAKFRWIGLTLFLVSVPALFVFAVLKMDRFAYDIEMTEAVYTEIKEGKEAYIQHNIDDNAGIKLRVLLWLLSAEIIAENPFGVGTGDIDFHLMEKCEKYNLQVLKQKNLNPHNQFFQTGIDIGFPGIILLLGIIVLNLVKGLKNKNYFLVFLVLSFSFNALFESVLQKQAGIVFYSCLVTLAVTYNDQLVFRNPLTREPAKAGDN